MQSHPSVLRFVLGWSAALALVAGGGAARAQGTEDGAGRAGAGEWRAASGLRLDQWIAPRGSGMGFDVRLTLPEMERGRFSVETFSWERLDVMEEELDPDPGTIYQVLGVRRWFGGETLGVFAGAHVMSWAGEHARGLTPWFGFRLGRAGGALLAAEVRLYGMGVVGWRGGGIDTGELAVRASGPRVGPTRIAARARLRRVADVQRDGTVSAGVETAWRGRPLFIGLGLQTLQRAADEPPEMMTLMATAGGQPEPVAPTSALMLQLELDMELPRSIAE